MEWTDIVAALTFQISRFSKSDYDLILDSGQNSSSLSKSLIEHFQNNPDWIAKSENLLNDFKRQNIRWLTPRSESYPERFLWMLEPPVFLTYIGDLQCLQYSRLSVVGSREPSTEGVRFLNQELGYLLQKVPLTIVSGAARGIDQAAHGCALRNRCPTVAVLPSGIANPYPRDFKQWYKSILKAEGCIISEYHPENFMKRHYFHRRNQLIVGLSKSLLVIEARRKSGTIMTARHARDNHCTVGVVPGFALDPQYGGSVDLLADGATIIRDHLDMAAMLASD